jgi:ABC-type transport system substrate-binding protein
MKRRSLRIAYGLAAVAAAAVLALAVFSAGLGERDWRTLELALGDNPTTLDPALIKDVSGGRLSALLYPNLVRYTDDGRLAGDLAEAWEVSPDGLVYTFHLRGGAFFSDGSAITARDVAASFERALAPEVASPRAWVLTGIRGADEFHAGKASAIAGLVIRSDTAIDITLAKPSGTFLPLLTMPSAGIVPAATPRKPFWGVDTFPAAGGPFRIARLDPDVALTLEANPRYYGERPLVERIRYRVIRNPFAAVAEFRQGRLDIIEVPDAFDKFFLGDARWAEQIDSVEGLNVYYLGFNCTRAPFDKREFRRAVAMAIDRDAIIANILHGKATAAKGPIPPGLSGYDAGLRGLPYDIDAARKAIGAAGAGGRTLSILALSNADTIIVAEALAGQLRAAGLSVDVAAREKGTFKALLAQGDFDMVYYSWVADYPDGENFLAPLFATAADRSGGNYTAYLNAEVDAALGEAARTADAAARDRLYRRAATVIVEDAPRAFLWHARRVTVRQPWVKGYRPARIYNAERFEGVSIAAPR